MKRKIILNLAMSIDGYIANEDGGFDWIVGDGDESLDTQNKWNYEKFLEGIDTVVMGRNVMIKVLLMILRIKRCI